MSKQLKNLRCEMTLQLEDEDDVEVIVTYNWQAGYAATLYGDYPEPACDDEFEIVEIVRADDSTQLVLLDSVTEDVYEYLVENETPAEDYENDRADYLYEQARDDAMEKEYYPED